MLATPIAAFYGSLYVHTPKKKQKSLFLHSFICIHSPVSQAWDPKSVTVSLVSMRGFPFGMKKYGKGRRRKIYLGLLYFDYIS